MADELTIAQKLKANLDALRQQGASPDELKDEIARAQQAINAKNQKERLSARDGVDKAGEVANTFADSATLGLSGMADDLVTSAFSKNRFADLRAARKQGKQDFATEHPVASLGTELAGAVATPTTGLAKVVGGIPRLAQFAANSPKLAKVAALMGEAGAQAGVSGAINGTDSFTTDALGRAAVTGLKDAARGSVAAPVVGGLLGRASTLVRKAGGDAPDAVRRVVREIGENATPEAKAALRKLKILDSRGLGDEAMVADVLGKRGNEGQRMLRASANTSPDAEATANTVLRSRDARVGQRAEDAIADATGVPVSDTRLAREEMTAAQREEADRLFGQARQEGAAFDAIPSKVSARYQAMEQGATQKALPAPGQSVSAKRDLPNVQDDIAWPGVPERTPRETVGQETLRDALESRAADRRLDAQGGARRVEVQAANDVNVRRDPVVGEPVAGAPDAFQQAEGLKKRALDDSHVQDQLQSLYAEDAALEKADPGSFDVMSRVYQRMNKEFGKLKAAGNDAGEYWNALNRARNKVRQALDVRSQTFPVANEAFAGKAKLDDAYELGTQLFNKPAGDLRLAQSKMSAEEARNFKRGLFDAIVEGKIDPKAANPDLGAAGKAASGVGQAAVNTRAAQKRLQEVLTPEEYRKLIGSAKAEGLFARTSNSVQGNSSTAKQLNDLGAFGSLAGDAVGMAVGSPMGAAGMARRVGNVALNAATLGSRTRHANELAGALTQKGDRARSTLESVIQEIARQNAAQAAGQRTGQRAADVTARLIGANQP